MKFLKLLTGFSVVHYVFLFGLAFLIRFYYARGFNGLYGQDAYAYFDAAALIARGQPLTPFFWGVGYPLTLASVFAVVGASAFVGQFINIIMGAALAPLIYLTARQIGLTMPSALLAGMLIAVCGQAVQSSIVIMADIPALFWALFSTIALLRHARTDRTVWLQTSAALLAFACMTRWLYLALIPVYALFLLATWRRVRVRPVIVASLTAVIVMLPQAAFSAINPFPVLDHAWVQGWSPLNAGRQSFVNIDGQFEYATINAQFYAAPLIDAYYLLPIFIPFVIVGIAALWRQRAVWWLLMGWWILPSIFLIGIPYQNIRFPLIVAPVVMLLAAAGVEWAIQRLPLPQKPILWIGVGIAAIGLSMFAFNPIVAGFVRTHLRDQETVSWALSHIPESATVYTMNLTLPLERVYAGEVRELYYETPATLAYAKTQEEAAYLLINLWQIENQWRGREPDIAVSWLRRRRGLTQIGRFGNYTLFAVHP